MDDPFWHEHGQSRIDAEERHASQVARILSLAKAGGKKVSRSRCGILIGLFGIEQLPILANLYPTVRTQSGRSVSDSDGTRTEMLWTLFVVLLVLWLLGMVSSYTMGGFIHILLVLALVALVFQLITGRRTTI
jgi:hypothetical protein